MQRGQEGFSLLEVLAATALFAIIIAAALGAVQAAFVAERLQVDQASAQAALRRAAEQLVQDLRLSGEPDAGFVCRGAPNESGEYVRVAVQPPDNPGETIDYEFIPSTGILFREGVSVAQGLSEVGFACGEHGVRIRLEAPPARQGQPSRRLEVEVALRS